MATLKELLPILAAGVAGAASPQGAEVFNRISAQDAARKQRALDEAAQQKRLGMAEEELGLRRESNKRDIRLADLRYEENERQKTERETERQNLEKARARFAEMSEKRHPGTGVVVSDLLAGEDSIQSMQKVTDSFLGEQDRLPDEQIIAQAKERSAQGIGSQVQLADGTMMYFPAQGRDEKPVPVTQLKDLYKYLDDYADGAMKSKLEFEQAKAEFVPLQNAIRQGVPDEEANRAAAAAKLKMESARNTYEWNLSRIERGVNSTPGLTEEGAGQIMNWYYQRIGAELPQPEQPAAADAAAPEQPAVDPVLEAYAKTTGKPAPAMRPDGFGRPSPTPTPTRQ